MISKQALIEVISKSAVLGTTIVFTANIGCLAGAYFITRDKGEIAGLGLITILLMIIGLLDLLAGLIIKGRLLAPLFAKPEAADENTLWRAAFRTTIAIASLCLALPLYGLVAVFVDRNMDAMVGFAIASLAGFMALRLRPRDFRKLNIPDN